MNRQSLLPVSGARVHSRTGLRCILGSKAGLPQNRYKEANKPIIMTESFPELKQDQVALLRADIKTGIVLDEQYNFATKPTQKVYTIFDNIDEALRFAKSIILKKKTLNVEYMEEIPRQFLF